MSKALGCASLLFFLGLQVLSKLRSQLGVEVCGGATRNFWSSAIRLRLNLVLVEAP